MGVERWRPVPGTDGWYEVSSHGRVRSWYRRSSPGWGGGTFFTRAEKPRLLKPYLDKRPRKGYLIVTLVVNGRKLRRMVHSLVAEAFLGERPQGYDICHWDGNSANNFVENLRYDTKKANQADRLRHGTRYGWRKKVTA